MLAIGGRNNLNETIKREIESMLRKEYQSLNGFARDIADGKYTGDDLDEMHIKLRARTYIDSVRQAIKWP
jgi:hypothetical protein